MAGLKRLRGLRRLRGLKRLRRAGLAALFQPALHGGEAVIPWYLAGGAVPSVVYQPFYSQSLAYSYTNLVTPGTLDAYVTPGGFSAPDLTVGAGWLGGAGRCLSCGASFDETSCFVFLVNITGNGGTGYGILYRSDNGSFVVSPHTGDGVGYFTCVAGTSRPQMNGINVLVMAGKDIYLNGAYQATIGAGASSTSIMHLANSGNPGQANKQLGGTLGAFALYAALTEDQVAAISAALLDQYTTPPAHSTTVITALGTSITAAASSWADRVGWMYNESYTTLNDHSAVGARVQFDLDGQVTAAAGDTPDAIIIEMGLNDNNGGDMGAIQAEAEENIVELQGDHPGTAIYWMFLPAYDGVALGSPLTAKGNIRTALEAACTAQGIPYWDTLTDPWILPTDTTDGWHPSAAGHAKIAAEVLARLP